MSMRNVAHPSIDQRRARGGQARERTPPSGHAGWVPAADRPDPVALLEEQNLTREKDLVPVRHGRMMVSPFTFYRGAAKIMAADLEDTPVAGLDAQLCGDAHLDEDELKASIRSTVAGTAGGEKGAKKAGRQQKPPKKHEKRAEKQDKAARKEGKRAEKTLDKAHTRDSLQALSKLGELVDGRYRIVSQPPIVVPARDLAAAYGMSPDEVGRAIREQFRAYRATLPDDRRQLLERFEVVDMARKVVGVGSVGTRAFIVLLQGRDAQDPLFLQVKEATASVLEANLRKSRYRQHGERGGAGPAIDAGRQRHLPRLDQGAGRAPSLLLAPAARHEGLGAGRGDGTGRAHVLRARLRVDARASPRPVWGPSRHCGVPGHKRYVRHIDHRLLPAVRGPERAGLSAVRDSDPIRPAGGI